MFDFEIPTFTGKNWEKHIEVADELDKIFLPCFARAIEVIENMKQKATPQRIAWMIIWTHIFKSLQGAQAAAHKQSDLSLNLINRSCMELELILFAITSPARTSNSNSNQAIKKNLTAYTAWCLWKDISAHNRRLERRNVNAFFDDSINREVANPDEIKFVEKLIGHKVELENPKEIEENRKSYEEKIWESLSRLEEIANNDEIKLWIEKLERSAKNRNWINSYFELIDESEKSIMDRLIKLDIAHTYSWYEETSLLQHASTFNQLFHLHTDGKAYPKIKVPADSIKNLANDICSTCNFNLSHLGLIKMYL